LLLLPGNGRYPAKRLPSNNIPSSGERRLKVSG
jgi:hypothetical protein